MSHRLPDLTYVAAPMINQSDRPFRLLVRSHGATLAFTQMLHPDRILNDQEYLEFHQRELGMEHDRPVVVQVCGNEVESVVQAAKKMVGYCDGVDLNLGCPQEAAREGHYGAYLLGQKDWPLVESMVSALSNSLPIPVSTKLRLCQPTSTTVTLAQRLENAGSSWITLHARHPSTRRRRQGAADLGQVKKLKEAVSVPVISNGNVRTWQDVIKNKELTGSDGIMVGETLLGNPCIFEGKVPDPVRISLEYLSLCRDHPETASMQTIQTHIRHFVDFQCGRRPWFTKFRTALAQCSTLEDIEGLLRRRVQRWRGESAAPLTDSDTEDASDADIPEATDTVDLSDHETISLDTTFLS